MHYITIFCTIQLLSYCMLYLSSYAKKSTDTSYLGTWHHHDGKLKSWQSLTGMSFLILYSGTSCSCYLLKQGTISWQRLTCGPSWISWPPDRRTSLRSRLGRRPDILVSKMIISWWYCNFVAMCNWVVSMSDILTWYYIFRRGITRELRLQDRVRHGRRDDELSLPQPRQAVLWQGVAEGINLRIWMASELLSSSLIIITL